jgi:ABC-type multidrug transport system ATPase subunit
LDLQFPDDRCHCLVGVNGVGKTSFLLSLTRKGVMKGSDGTRHQAMYLAPRELISSESLTVAQYAALFRPPLALDHWGLERIHRTSVQVLSLGEKTRLCLSVAQSIDPAVLLLDEPSIGLDLESQALLTRFLEDRISRRRVTIISTHDLAALDTDRCRILYMHRHEGSVSISEADGQILTGAASVEFEGEAPTRLEGSAARIARSLLDKQIARFR